MAYYLTTYCDGTEGPIIDSVDVSVVSGVYFIQFNTETPSGCYTIGDETTDLPTEGITTITPYNDCLDCLQQNNFSFIAADCEFPEIIGEVSSLYFNQFPIAKFYKFCFPDFENPEITTCFCLEILGISPFDVPAFPVEMTGPFFVCGCYDSPRSAGTEYFECVICCDCGASGSTVTQVSPPHPVWTDGYGTPVTQLNMVTLGGMFGLNR